MEVIKQLKPIGERMPVKVAIFDFDGTISTLRKGWESLMESLMLSLLSHNEHPSPQLINEVKEYIDESTGIQTIFQMEWLAEQILKKFGTNLDPWEYKAMYNKELLNMVNKRIAFINSNSKTPEDFRIKGSISFVKALVEKGVSIYVASGTDDEDLQKEIDILELRPYVTLAKGAPSGKSDCSKEKVIRELIVDKRLTGEELVVIGDGKVEIKLGNDVGAITIATATDEEKCYGVNPIKREKLVKVGAHLVIGDFLNQEEILSWLFGY